MSGTRRLAVVGDVFLDRDVEGRTERLCPDAPAPVVDVEADWARPGGAGLAAVLAARDGRPVTLVAAFGDDVASGDLRRLLAHAGVDVVDIGHGGSTPEKVRVVANGRRVARIDRGGTAGPESHWHADADAALESAAAVLVADYGRGVSALPEFRQALTALIPGVPVVWDPHPRGPAPVPGVRLVTPNREEAARLVPTVDGDGLAADADRAQVLAARWAAGGVAVTRGGDGALFWDGSGPPLAVPAQGVTGDVCGAGDRFASTAAGRLADGALPSEAVAASVEAATAFVAAGGAGAVARSPEVAPAVPDGRTPAAAPAAPAANVVAACRSAGGTVVATGGCFDLLHVGHVSVLQSARALGDCLVVCLNSDASVRRLKGPGRPVVSAADRATLLLALDCVDAVAVFDEDTPMGVLEKLRPDVWVKGADYSGPLPEAETLAGWGGRAVVVPFLEGRSTTTVLERLASSGAASASP